MGMKRIRIRDDLYNYLKRRADRHFRQPAGELNAILLELKDEEDRETELAEKVIQLVPVPDEQRGPLPTQSGFRGVYAHGKAWMARTTRDGQKVKIGVYKTPEEAAQAYDDYIRGLAHEHGGYAPLNFPREGEEQAMPLYDGGWPDEETRIMATQPPRAEDLPGGIPLPEKLQAGLRQAGLLAELDDYPPPVPDPDIDPDPRLMSIPEPEGPMPMPDPSLDPKPAG